jgi:hypothetical protein
VQEQQVAQVARRTESRMSAAPTRGGSSLFLTQKGLQIPPRLSFEKWIGIGQQLSSLTTSIAWCLGDWLVYGETVFTGRYREAVERTSLDYQTLRNYAWVAKRFALSRRREALSFGHHAEVAALPEIEQDYWLGRAEELSWSRNKMRAEVRRSLRERAKSSPELPVDADASEPGPAPAISSELTLEVRLSAMQLETYQLAAVTCGLSLEKWALQALAEIARGELSLE